MSGETQFAGMIRPAREEDAIRGSPGASGVYFWVFGISRHGGGAAPPADPVKTLLHRRGGEEAFQGEELKPPIQRKSAIFKIKAHAYRFCRIPGVKRQTAAKGLKNVRFSKNILKKKDAI